MSGILRFSFVRYLCLANVLCNKAILLTLTIMYARYSIVHIKMHKYFYEKQFITLVG